LFQRTKELSRLSKQSTLLKDVCDRGKKNTEVGDVFDVILSDSSFLVMSYIMENCYATAIGCPTAIYTLPRKWHCLPNGDVILGSP
jgi:hypothetical protein